MDTIRSLNLVRLHTRTLSIPYCKLFILSLNDHFHGKLMSDCNLISAAEDLKSEEDRLAADKWQLAIMKLRCCGCWMILTSAIWMQQSSIRNSQEDNVTMEHFITSNGHVSLGKRCWELTEGNVSLRTKSVFTRFGSDKEQWDDRRSPHKSKMQPNGPSSGKPS